MTIDYRQDEVDVLIALIRRDNMNKPLSRHQVWFGEPQPSAPTPTNIHDTTVVATAVEGAGLSGKLPFYYTRMHLSDFLFGIENAVMVNVSTETKLSEILPNINQQLSINVPVDKIVDRDIRDLDEVSLRVRDNSYIYAGSLMVYLVRDGNIPLGNAILISELDGFSTD